MKEKKQKNSKPQKADRPGATQNAGTAPKQPKPVSADPGALYARTLVAAVIVVITFFAFFPSLHNGLLKTWDDQAYVTNNDLVKSLSVANIVKIFKEDKGQYANYHPLTTLSLAVNYHFSKEEPFGYHFTNLLLHLLNTLLVFVFIYFLSKNNLVIAAVTALLFGVSPVHVESVAWISERKDVLYTLFFLASLISYQLFLKRADWKWYALSMLFFLCSILSKAMAASLPLVLLLVGFMETGKWKWKMLPDKLPYFVVALLLGLYAVRIQAQGNAIGGIMFPLLFRILHAGYGFIAYIVKIFIPTGLSAFYPYPYPLVNAGWVIDTPLPVFYLTLILTIAVLCFSVYGIFSGRRNLQAAGFGILFYALTIVLVLQFLPVGRAVMADRYAYVPSIGLFFIAGYFASLFNQKKNFRIPVILVMAVYALFLVFLTLKQTRVWENDETLWNNTIQLYPLDNRIALVYGNRSQYYQMAGKPAQELKDLLVVVQSNPKDDVCLEKIGKIYGADLHDQESANTWFAKAYEANPQNIEVIKDLVIVYGMKGDFNKSLEFSLKGLEIEKNDAFLLYNTGITYRNLGKPDLAKDYIRKAGEIDPKFAGK